MSSHPSREATDNQTYPAASCNECGTYLGAMYTVFGVRGPLCSTCVMPKKDEATKITDLERDVTRLQGELERALRAQFKAEESLKGALQCCEIYRKERDEVKAAFAVASAKKEPQP